MSKSVLRNVVKRTNSYFIRKFFCASMEKVVVSTDSAPKAIGPYSQAIQTEHHVYVSGQIGMCPSTSKLVSGGVEAETRQALKNLGEILKASGTTYSDVVKTTIFLKRMSDFDVVNNVYKDVFMTDYPARSTVEVSKLPRDASVEIEAIAIISPPKTADGQEAGK